MGAVLAINAEKKTNTSKVNSKNKNKTNIWYIIHSIVLQTLRILMNLKNYHLTLCIKNWIILKKTNKFKTVSLQTDENRVLKPKVLDNVGDLFDKQYYIYKNKYNKEKDGLCTTNKKIYYYKKLRLDDYQYESEDEEKKQQQTSKKSDKKKPPKKTTKEYLREFNEWVDRKETCISSETFQKFFNFQRPSNMVKGVYTTNDKKKNNMIKSVSSDLKNKIEDMSEEEKEIEKPNKIIDVIEKFLSLTKKINPDKD